MNNPQLAFALVIVFVLLLLVGAFFRGRRAKRKQWLKDIDARARRNVWRNARIHGVLVAREEAAARNCK
jgi:hypothetical protein